MLAMENFILFQVSNAVFGFALATGCLEKSLPREILNKIRSFVCTHLIFAWVYLKVWEKYLVKVSAKSTHFTSFGGTLKKCVKIDKNRKCR